MLVLVSSDGADQAEEGAKEDEADGVSFTEFAFSSAQSVPPKEK